LFLHFTTEIDKKSSFLSHLTSIISDDIILKEFCGLIEKTTKFDKNKNKIKSK